MRIIEDVTGVSLCGALKSRRISIKHLIVLICTLDVVAIAAGFVDGLDWGSNAKGLC